MRPHPESKKRRNRDRDRMCRKMRRWGILMPLWKPLPMEQLKYTEMAEGWAAAFEKMAIGMNERWDAMIYGIVPLMNEGNKVPL